eukprot:10263081-Lingulodinium_polyedra.AAC.1
MKPAGRALVREESTAGMLADPADGRADSLGREGSRTGTHADPEDGCFFSQTTTALMLTDH